MAKYTVLTYMYRDDSNYKEYKQVAVEGEIKEEEIRKRLADGRYFVPEAVYLPPAWEGCGDQPHELVHVDYTDDRPVVYKLDLRSPDEFLRSLSGNGFDKLWGDRVVELFAKASAVVIADRPGAIFVPQLEGNLVRLQGQGDEGYVVRLDMSRLYEVTPFGSIKVPATRGNARKQLEVRFLAAVEPATLLAIPIPV